MALGIVISMIYMVLGIVISMIFSFSTCTKIM